MPWYLRKSFGSKSFRVNLSKGGIGVSTGIKGFRVSTNHRGTYVNMGSGGIYYRQRIGGPYGAPTPSGRQASPPAQPPAPTADGLDPIATASASQLVDQPSSVIIARINARLKEPTYAWVPWFLFGAVALATLGWEPAIAILSILIGLAIGSAVHRRDVILRTYPLLFELDPLATQRWDSLNLALSALANSQRLWRVLAQGAVSDWKRSAGASSTVHRVAVSLKRQAPPFIATNVQPFCLNLGSQLLCFMPDRVLIYEAGQYGAIDYSNLRVEIGATNFIESEAVAPDATVVGSTWQYVNKSGGPDRRFSNNRQLAICNYQTIRLTSGLGMDIVLHASSHGFQGLPFAGSVGQAPRAASAPPPKQPRAAQPRAATVPSCFAALGLAPNCTAEEAQAAYRALVKLYHPDLVANMAPEFRLLAEERMKEINQAYCDVRRARGW